MTKGFVIKDIMILKADKGNTTVILDRTEYDKKMIYMLNDKTTSKLLKKDPRKCVNRN